MSRIAFLYPGQGAQEVGMAGDFYEKSEEAKAVFDQASSILDFDVREICFQKNDLLDKIRIYSGGYGYSLSCYYP